MFRVSERRRSGRVWADVKSEAYDVSDSVPKSIKFEDVENDVALEKEVLDNGGPWWEEFPKRWVIVILCFSAFLLCNMDRVRKAYFKY